MYSIPELCELGKARELIQGAYGFWCEIDLVTTDNQPSLACINGDQIGYFDFALQCVVLSN